MDFAEGAATELGFPGAEGFTGAAAPADGCCRAVAGEAAALDAWEAAALSSSGMDSSDELGSSLKVPFIPLLAVLSVPATLCCSADLNATLPDGSADVVPD